MRSSFRLPGRVGPLVDAAEGTLTAGTTHQLFTPADLFDLNRAVLTFAP